jgi:hypothetical protein
MYYFSISEAVRGKKEKWGSEELCWQPPVFLTLGQMTTILGRVSWTEADG